jgi:Na+/H+-dicarboxylate symporter
MTEKKGFMSWYFGTNLLFRILIGLVLGCIVGIILGYMPSTVGPFRTWAQPFGDLLVRLLKMIVVPVIFFSLVAGSASLSPSRLGKVGVKIMAYYLFTSALAVAIGLLFANIFKPGVGLNIVGVATAAAKKVEAPSLAQTLLAIVPTNPVEALVKTDVLAIIFFALVFGIAASALRESKIERVAQGATLVYNFCDGAAETMYKIVGGIMQYAPIGVFCLISIVFATQGPKAFGPLVLVTLTVYIGLLVHYAGTYGGFLKVFRFGFWKFTKMANEAMVTAFVTRSSNGTLPVTMRVTEENMGVPRSICSFTLPLGATINMDGTAIYLGVCAMFIGYATGQPLTSDQQLVVIITATLASIGTAGVPGAGSIMLIMVLESVNLKVDAGSAVAAAYAMILGIDALLDMGRTCLNVTGDMVGTVIVARTEKELDESKWQGTEQVAKAA